jgi:hypothetical protein
MPTMVTLYGCKVEVLDLEVLDLDVLDLDGWPMFR